MKKINILIIVITILYCCKGNDVYKYIKEGDDYLSQDRYELAIEKYTEAIKLKPDYHYIYMMRCEAYYKQKNFHLAINDCSKAIELKKDNTTAYVNRGRSYAAIKQYDLAIKDINKAMELNPSLSSTFKILLSRIEEWKREDKEEKQNESSKPISVF